MTTEAEGEPPMFKTVVVGIDGLEGGRDALSLAGRLAGLSGGRLVAVHNLPVEFHGLSAEALPVVVAAAEDARAELREALDRAGLAARMRVLADGSAARALHRVAVEERADLIVIGSTSRGPRGRVPAGDHAAATLHGAPCPVVVAPRAFAGRMWGAVTRVGVGFDGRPEARRALAFAAGLARGTGAVLKVETVVEPPLLKGDPGLCDPGWLEAAMADAREELDAALRDVDVAHSGRVVAGPTADGLADLSAHVDLLVVGSRAWGPVRRILLGSTAARLMRASHCPVLVLPRGAATGEPGEQASGAGTHARSAV
jgi:nucleotide-binding universal stress UspA family protein